MEIMPNKLIILFFAFVNVVLLNAQQELSSAEAVAYALEYNHGIKIAKNLVEVAENNASVLNSGYLPSISGLAGGSYNVSDAETEFNDGRVTSLRAAESSRYNASINLNYTLFDGLGRYYDYKSLKEDYQLSELEARETIENTIVQMFSVYYNVAQITENLKAVKETIDVSKDRLTRAEYQFDYGQNTKLDVLNAEVDINNDSINLINIEQRLINAKRDLNFVLGSTVVGDFNVETMVDFMLDLNKEVLHERMKLNNVTLLQLDKNIIISEYTIKATKSGYLPAIGLSGSYGWNKNNNNAASFAKGSQSTGLNAGLNLTWNLFDGGNTITRVQNAKLNLEAQQLQKDQIITGIERDFNNSWDDYQNRLRIYRVQEENIKTSQNNFDRTQEKFKLGQVSSIEFRQAQVNLVTAEVSRNQAKFEAKLAELIVLQLSGELLNVEF